MRVKVFILLLAAGVIVFTCISASVYLKHEIRLDQTDYQAYKKEGVM